MRNVVAPVTSSPAMRARCTGAAPRQAGSSEKCRFTQPCAGRSSAAFGTSAPYATTGTQSGASCASRARNSGSDGRRGCSTSSPAASAQAATGDRDRCRPRPDGASGRVTTPTNSCPEAAIASSAGTATCGVPAKSNLTGQILVCRPRALQRPAEGGVRALLDDGGRLPGPLRLPDRLERELALVAVHAVDEEDPVEVVGLVLDRAGEQLAALDRDRLPVQVESLGDDAQRP